MTTFWVILWTIIKWSAIVGGCFVLISICIAVFHPIYFTLKGRASIKGQRGELNLSYLFNRLKIRCVAGAHTQELWLEIFGWKKLLQRETRKRTSVAKIQEEPAETNQQKKDWEELSSIIESEIGVNKRSESDSVDEKYDEFDNKVVDSETEEFSAHEESAKISEIQETEKIEKTEKTSEMANDKDFQSEANLEAKTEKNNEKAFQEKQEADFATEILESESVREEATAPKVVVEPEYKVEATPEQLAQLQSILEEEERKEQEEVKKDDWNQKLRKFKKDFNRRYDELRRGIRLIRQKWISLWPVVKRFWQRGKKGFRFHNTSLKIMYSLDEHYLTGMLYGYIAPTIGFAKKYGIDWTPVPLFPEKPGMGVYSRMEWHLDIRPYMLIWAVLGLLLEKNIYKEIYWLYKYGKSKKAEKATKSKY